MPKATILIVDDEPDTLTLLREIMEKEGYQVHTATSSQAALDNFAHQTRMWSYRIFKCRTWTAWPSWPKHENAAPSPRSSCSLLTDRSRPPWKVLKPEPSITSPNLSHWKKSGPSSGGDARAKHQPLLPKGDGISQIQGNSPLMVAVYKLIARVAPTESTVLIHGETGTGKELIARAIHANSLRNEWPFIAVDCGTLTENLLESELFGHERGAFTGAITLKKGLLESANHGTCFLDEIGDITPNLQSKLLRVLQEHEIRRVGGMESLKVDVRIIAATNKNLKKLVEAGKFREDLYYRLNVVMLHLPSLRERVEDIPTLINYFLTKYTQINNKVVTGVHHQALELLTQYSWSGNVRELEHTIEPAVVMTPHSLIMPHDLPLALVAPPTLPDQSPSHPDWKTLEQLEREHILKVLDAQQGDENRTAELLGIHRKTLQRKPKEYGLRYPPLIPAIRHQAFIPVQPS